MKIIICILLSSMLLIGCSKKSDQSEQEVVESHPILGYWVSDDYSYILKINKENTEFTFLSRGASNSQVNACPNVTLNEKQVVLNCPLTQDKDFGMALNESNQLVSTRQDMPGHLNKMPNIDIKSLVGTWKDRESNGTRSTIYVTHQRENDYDLETFDIYERQKKYKHYFDKAFKTTFSNGFMFTEKTQQGEKITYIVEVTDQWYRAVDQTGYSWVASKYDGDMNKDLQEQGYSLVE